MTGRAIDSLIDVRDMTCAQALAVVARAVAQLVDGQCLDILYNTQDVKHDLMAWAKDQGLIVVDNLSMRLSLHR